MQRINAQLISGYGMIRMSSIMLNKVEDIIVSPLTQLIHYLFPTVVFPDALKIACVAPVYKSSDKTDKNNYRPISVISLSGKIAENVYILLQCHIVGNWIYM